MDYFEFPVINVEYALLVLAMRKNESTFFQISMKVVWTSSPSINGKDLFLKWLMPSNNNAYTLIARQYVVAAEKEWGRKCVVIHSFGIYIS